MERITQFVTLASPGEHSVRMPEDADVFDIRVGDGGAHLVLTATVTVNEAKDNPEPTGLWETRFFHCARENDVLPSERFSGYRKKYKGAARDALGRWLYIWECGPKRSEEDA